MKILTKLPSDNIENIFLDICIKSKSGCNVIVGDKNYNISINNYGVYVISEFNADIELTEEEFKKSKK